MQKKKLEAAFSEDDWLYVDCLSDEGGLSLAQDFGVENLPTLVLMKEDKVLYKEEGVTEASTIKKMLKC